VADPSGKGSLGGAEAFQFFMRSKVHPDVLKNVWTVADQPSTGSLDLRKFAIAVRLIQLSQNGQKGQGPTLAVTEGVVLRPVFFEGISGVSVPLPSAPGLPPTQQQAPISPDSVQQSPARNPNIAQPPSTMGQSLVAQDPYVMTPQDRARYEDLFPQYANPDGFMYGKEAVELFMKSGVDAGVLREIWSLVDRPVDNRLDKLEFALAMHLIICISKKNLPAPKGSLPNSLKALKAASSAPVGVPTPGAAGLSRPAVPPSPQVRLSPKPQAEIPSPPRPQSTTMGMPSSFPSTGGPPPIVAMGGGSISDAFEGLSMTPGGPSTLPSYVPEQQQPSYGMTTSLEEPVSAPLSFEASPPSPEAVPLTPPRSTNRSVMSHDSAASTQELDKLKAVLQKLQAENISLKAQLGNMSEDDKSVQKELSTIVGDIAALSAELQARRSEVLQAKTRLLEASAELKAAHDRKG